MRYSPIRLPVGKGARAVTAGARCMPTSTARSVPSSSQSIRRSAKVRGISEYPALARLALEEVYDRMARNASVDLLQLSVGVSFHLDQSPDFNAEGRRLPTLGWRNRLRKPPTGFRPLSLPDWVNVRDDSSHIELTLGPSAFDLDARDTAKVRDIVVESGLL
jgi:hypothetical protein